MNSLNPEECDAIVEKQLREDYEQYGLAGFEARYGRNVHIGLHTCLPRRLSGL